MNNDLYWSLSINISGYYPSVRLNRQIYLPLGALFSAAILDFGDGTEIRLLQRPEPRFRKICAL